VIGAGSWGGHIATALGEARGITLAGIADADAARSAATAAELGTRYFKTVADSLADPAIDAVAIALPNDLHAETAVEALQRGKHVFIEKPIALTTADAERIERTASERGRVAMVDHIQRFYEPLVKLEQLVRSGALGRVQAASVSRRDFLHREKSWLQQRRRVGGMLYQSACHEYDFLCWICGPVVDVRCLRSPDVIASGTLDYADMIVTQLRFESGAIGQVWNCMTDPLVGYDGVVTGTEGSAWFDLYDARLRVSKIDEEPTELRFEPADGWAPWAWIATGGLGVGERRALVAAIEDFASATRGQQPTGATAGQGARVIEIAQAGYLSIAEDRVVELPLAEDDRARATYLEDLVGTPDG
jgi:UDP-2-acetamido-3-amino-2,3-dideoxy-glucuronate N-acetyltransferase